MVAALGHAVRARPAGTGSGVKRRRGRFLESGPWVVGREAEVKAPSQKVLRTARWLRSPSREAHGLGAPFSAILPGACEASETPGPGAALSLCWAQVAGATGFKAPGLAGRCVRTVLWVRSTS